MRSTKRGLDRETAEKRVRVFGSWNLTKGRFWSLFGCYILAWIFGILVAILGWVVAVCAVLAGLVPAIFCYSRTPVHDLGVTE